MKRRSPVVGDVRRAVEGTGVPFDATRERRARAERDLVEPWDEIAGAVSHVVDRLTLGELSARVHERLSLERATYV
ncbi:MAG TPA: hypothetical protein VLF19_06625 [Methylomirabilota bacterium]|nr:hypothetical protein [Methylomirabilota bacterium]